MTDNRTTELLPCPFCGGEAEVFNPFDKTAGTWCVICRECACASGFEQTEAEAIAAWNTRAERTCHNARKPHENRFKCSECGRVVWLDEPTSEPVFYCPNCGRKVVSA